MAKTSKKTAKKATAKKTKANGKKKTLRAGASRKAPQRGENSRYEQESCPMCGYGGEKSMHRTASRNRSGEGYGDYNPRTSNRGGQERFMDEDRLSRRRGMGGEGEDDRFYRSRMRGSRYAEDEDYGPGSLRNGPRQRDWSGEPERYAESARNSHDYD